MRTIRTKILLMSAAAWLPCFPANAQESAADVREELAAAREEIQQQREQLDQQEQRLRALEQRLGDMVTAGETQGRPPVQAAGIPRLPAQPGEVPLETVGQAPDDYDLPIELAIAGPAGSVITRAGQLTVEGQFEYARADRNRAIFRGIEIIESVLIGVFDINESRQDVLTSAPGLRYGVTDRWELGVRVPFVYRSDASILAPVQGSTQDDAAATIDNSAKGSGLGDVELSARYQITDARPGSLYLVGNLQAVFPTGRGPFSLNRDSSGRALEAATGAGFYGISPSVTAILPTDPVVLFGTLGYTFNLPEDVDTQIPPVRVVRVDPGDAVSASAGIGIAFNQDVSVNFGYAHSWAFGTKTWTQALVPGPNDPGIVTRTSRDLQIGRFLFGVTRRINERSSFNWAVEIGATDDATDLRTSIRIPVTLFNGR